MSENYASSLFVEAEGKAILRPYLEERSDGLVMLTKGRLAQWLQCQIGDAVANARGLLAANDGETVSVEIKTERKHTGNLFLETWSNRNLDSRDNYYRCEPKPGWFVTLRASQLLYYFLDTDTLYCIDMFALKRWAFGWLPADGVERQANIYRFPLRKAKCDQLNQTYGYLVPVEVLNEKLGRAFRQTSVVQRSLLNDAPLAKHEA